MMLSRSNVTGHHGVEMKISDLLFLLALGMVITIACLHHTIAC
ncbi:hypothetical protein [Aeromonas phage 32]|nr:hypothetical protein [Aeromonas phage 32]